MTSDNFFTRYLAADRLALDPEKQTISWKRENWSKVWKGEGRGLPGSGVLDLIDAEVSAHGTIRRSWTRGLADGDPILFLAVATIWGYGNYVRWGRPALRAMLSTPDVAAKVRDIVEASRRDPRAGFGALFDAAGRTRIRRLSIAFGTKVVHFGGYDHAEPRPVILDARVHATASRLSDHPPVPDPRRYTTGDQYRA